MPEALKPVPQVLDERFGVVKGVMTTTHSYTGDQCAAHHPQLPLCKVFDAEDYITI